MHGYNVQKIFGFKAADDADRFGFIRVIRG